MLNKFSCLFPANLLIFQTSEDDLRNLFSDYGNVKATKIIVDKAGNSKG